MGYGGYRGKIWFLKELDVRISSGMLLAERPFGQMAGSVPAERQNDGGSLLESAGDMGDIEVKYGF